MQAMSDKKQSRKQSMDNRTTKTKASATKPQVFGISLTRNKNNPNPILFNSVKKKKSQILQERPNHFHYQSEKKHKSPIKHGPSLYDDLNIKVSIDYINSLHSDLLVQFGFNLKSQFQNKQNHISARNVAINLPSRQQKECLNQIKELIKLKDQINQSYKYMKNTQDLFSYLAHQEKEPNLNTKIRKTNDINDIHKAISIFLKDFYTQQKELEKQQQKYEDFTKNTPQQEEKSQEEIDEEYLDSIIQSLKEEIAHEKKLSLRFEKEEKFLINKLYFTQKKNNDLKTSSSNLKIKNTNLRDTIKLAHSNSTQKFINSPKLHRSFSVKLQRIKRYNFEDQNTSFNQALTKTNQITRSKSTSSLQIFQKGSYLSNIKKETFLDRIN